MLSTLLEWLTVLLSWLSLLLFPNAVHHSSSSSSSSSSLTAASSNSTIPKITIGRDVHGHAVEMPLLGAGTWQYNDSVAYDSVCKAFRAGYTMVDTAYGYKNQKGVGKAIRDCWKGTRDELFVLTKIPGGLDLREAFKAHRTNLLELGLGYVDHLMTHFPADWEVTPSRSSKERRQQEWIALENAYLSGEARSIGISHYCPKHIDDIMEVAVVNPSLNQVEYHVGSGDVDKVIQKCHDSNIKFMSFSPLCGPCTYDESDSLVSGELVTKIGQQYNVSGSQVALRFIVQQALEQPFMAGVIPKSNNLKHIRSNMDIFSFQLSKEDMNALKAATKPAAEAGDCDVP